MDASHGAIIECFTRVDNFICKTVIPYLNCTLVPQILHVNVSQ